MRTRIEAATIPADLLPRVERIAALLDQKLQVFQSFDIEAALSAVPHADNHVRLRVGVRDDEGVMRWAPDSRNAASEEPHDKSLGWLVSEAVYQLTSHLHAIIGENLHRKLNEMQRRESHAVEA